MTTEPPGHPPHPVVELRLLAWRKGYDFDRLRGDMWQLVHVADRTVAMKPNGSTKFSFDEAKAFLEALPDA